jgi:N-methylhydantoinase A/oxoprolinase/acetone carboxylase beta subunit
MRDPLGLFEAAAHRGAKTMAAVAKEQLTGPTPCDEWSVQHLMDHMAGGPAYLLAAAEGRTPAQVKGVTADDYRERVDEALAALAAEAAAIVGADASVETALDCRYVGQGYELRVTLPPGQFTPDALEQFHELHAREYGSAYEDPIEIVNARVTAIGKRPTLDELPVARGSLEDALLGESESHFRVDGMLQALATRFYDRSLLPLDESFDGPAVVFHLDTTTVVAPGWRARAERSGNLLLTKAGGDDQ